MNWLKVQSHRNRQESVIDKNKTRSCQKAHTDSVERSLDVQILLARPQF